MFSAAYEALRGYRVPRTSSGSAILARARCRRGGPCRRWPGDSFLKGAVPLRPAGIDPQILPKTQNFYSVPWLRIGQILPVRITETELIIYAPEVSEIARHALLPAGAGLKRTDPGHAPTSDERRRHEILVQRFSELGPQGTHFLEELVHTRRYGKVEAHRVLALLAHYERHDLVAALERACRYRAFSLTAVERILSAQAQPKSVLTTLDDEARRHLQALLGAEPLEPRSTADYLHLLEQDSHAPDPSHEAS